MADSRIFDELHEQFTLSALGLALAIVQKAEYEAKYLAVKAKEVLEDEEENVEGSA